MDDLEGKPTIFGNIHMFFGILKRINSQICLALGRFDVVVVWSWWKDNFLTFLNYHKTSCLRIWLYQFIRSFHIVTLFPLICKVKLYIFTYIYIYLYIPTLDISFKSESMGTPVLLKSQRWRYTLSQELRADKKKEFSLKNSAHIGYTIINLGKL